MTLPVPVTFEPTWADEWLVWVTILSIAGSMFLGIVALKNANMANKIAENQKDRDIRETVRDSAVKILSHLREIDSDLDLQLDWSFLKERSKAEGWGELSDLINAAIDFSKTEEFKKGLPIRFRQEIRELLASWIIDPKKAKLRIDHFRSLEPTDFLWQSEE